ncbi:MAG TPA: methyltransferase domain-containing protein [Gammaproteobacteria bacterium]|nr:methyltransferase domain-containing protein [Gammaproteobacteria bacterium]
MKDKIDTGFKFKEFCSLDDSPIADYLIKSMDIMLSLASIQQIKKESINLLNLKPGQKVLEAGCGLSNEVELMAGMVGEEGRVIAIDTSHRMLEIAKSRVKSTNIIFQNMPVEAIEYPDNFFSACHADRLLVSHQNYDEIFVEMLRVLKPGGNISITDVDASTLVITPYTSTTKIVIDQILSSFVNPTMGRKLLNIFSLHNLHDIKIRVNLSTIEDFKTLEKIFDFHAILKSCVKEGKLSEQDVNFWYDLMEMASQKKRFLYCITFFTVSGIKSD